ncbi:MAG: nuclear transport factor 2 family protein [Myxococcota bacterium]
MGKLLEASLEPAHEPEADRIRSLTRDLERVEGVNLEFYEAFSAKDLDRMSRLWAKTPHVRCVHPGWELVTGYGEVLRSWQDIFSSIEDVEVTINDVQIEVIGQAAWVNQIVDLAITTEEEETFEASVVTTNLFEYAQGSWLLVLHHSSNFVEADDEDEGEGEETEDNTRVFGLGPRGHTSN